MFNDLKDSIWGDDSSKFIAWYEESGIRIRGMSHSAFIQFALDIRDGAIFMITMKMAWRLWGGRSCWVIGALVALAAIITHFDTWII